MSEEGKMMNRVFAFCIIFLMGCISTQGKLTTFIDYLPGDQAEAPTKQKVKKKSIKKYNTKSGHDLTFSREWNYVLGNDGGVARYSGIKTSITNPNRFFRFSMTALMSPTIVVYNDRGFGPQPSSTTKSHQEGVQVLSIQKQTYFVFLPSLSAPVIRYDLDVNFGSKLKVHTNIEFRTGLGYEWRIIYSHGVYDVYLLGDALYDIYLPNDIKNETYFTQINTLDINIEPIHFETNLVLNRGEFRLSFGMGAIW